MKSFLKCIGDFNTFFVFYWKNSCIFCISAVNINNKIQESDSLIAFAYWLHVFKISTPSVISIRWIYFVSLKFFSDGPVNSLSNCRSSEIIHVTVWVVSSVFRFFVKYFVDYWDKSSLISIIFWINSNYKCL